MRPLIIGERERAQIKKVLAHADVHRASIHDLIAIVKGNREPPGNDPAFTVHLPVGYKVVFTIEQQPIGWCRHLSVSVATAGCYPATEAVEALAEAFGFRHKLKDQQWSIGLEKSVQAVNIIEKLED